MLTFTEAARERVLAFLQDFGEDGALRVSLAQGSSPFAPDFELELIERGDHEEGDVAVNTGDFPLFIGGSSVPRLEGAVVDFVAGAFEVSLPPADAGTFPGGELATRVAQVLERAVNPAVAAHGGRITLVGVQDNVAYVRMNGGCQGCGLAAVTLRQGVERMLREAVPEIVAVQDVTDHASGRNPFVTQ